MGRVGYNRSPIFKFKEVCFRVDGKWECTLTDKAGSYHYIKTRKKIKHPAGVACLVCGNITISERGSFDICPVCLWEDDGEYDNPKEVRGGPNGDLSLEGARRNYLKFGAVEKHYIKDARPPTPNELA
ncbi:hypothetical protein JNJ66_06080 [Candidatus Saccharibacteria bacterium]|nr:hypothetical protein [Candidatus Saccharibacteria bacterium]